MATIKKVSTTVGASTEFKQRIRGEIQQVISLYFQSTLGTVPDIVNIVMGLIHKESAFRPSVPGLFVSSVPTAVQPRGSSRARQYLESSPVVAILQSGTPEQKARVPSGQKAMGLMQVMGWNIVRAGSSKSKKCEIEEAGIPQIVDIICVHAGDSIEAKLLGDANTYNNIVAGLTILHTKYRASRPASGGWSAGGAVFSSRIAAAVGAYLGVGGVDLRTGITADQYVSSIIGGSSYRLANSTATSGTATTNATAAASGPTTNGANVTATSPGCG